MYVMLFEELVRLVITSANLTEPGFRRNREGAVVLDCSATKRRNAPVIADSLQKCREAIGRLMPAGMSNCFNEISQQLRQWILKGSHRDRSINVVWGGMGQSLPNQIFAAWPGGERVCSLDVVSPFWSSTDATPLSELLNLFQSSGDLNADVRIQLFCEARPEADPPLPSIPPILGIWARERKELKILAFVVSPAVNPEDCPELKHDELRLLRRPLHTKMIILRGQRASMAYLGSANCTRKGWGCGIKSTNANIETGVLMSSDRHADAFDYLLPRTSCEGLDLSKCSSKVLQYCTEIKTIDDWPGFLEEILLMESKTSHVLYLAAKWQPRLAPATWGIALCNAGQTIGSRLWTSTEKDIAAGNANIPLGPDELSQIVTDREVVVFWASGPKTAHYPIIVSEEAKSQLPLSPGVKPPGEEALLDYYQGKLRWEDLYPEPGAPPPPPLPPIPGSPGSVDTEQIQAYQVRRFVEALPGLVTQLAETPHNERAFHRALFGPVSPCALAKLIVAAKSEGRRSLTAASFQLIELRFAVARAFARVMKDKVDDRVISLFRRTLHELKRLSQRITTKTPGSDGSLESHRKRVDREISSLLGN
jgi:hypothetical protein